MQSAKTSYDLTGLSITDTGNPITTYDQIHGSGIVRNVVLAVPSHLNSSSPVVGDAPWNSLEHVEVPPGSPESGTVASVGLHEQSTDEIYYIYQGKGRLNTHGVSEIVSAGSLVIAPKGTRHSVENPFSDTPLAFLVIELHAGPDDVVHRPCVITSLPAKRKSGFQATHAGQPIELRVAQIDLAGYFSAPWGALSVVEVPPGARLDEYTLPTEDENLFIVSGFATIFVTDVQIDHPDTEGHRNVVVPWGVPHRVVNNSSRDHLTVLSVRVRRQVEGTPRSYHALDQLAHC